MRRRFFLPAAEPASAGVGSAAVRSPEGSAPSVEQVPGPEVTYRELLVTAELGLIEGDVTRPYVHPVAPQGDVDQIIEAARLTAEAIRAAYEALPPIGDAAERVIRFIRASSPPAKEAVDDAVRVAFVLGVLDRPRRRFRARSNRGRRR